MPLPKELTTVTRLSKYLALSLFIILPITAFLLGMRYQGNLTNEILFQTPTPLIQETITNSENKCRKYGNAPNESFLTTYTIKKGDTLLSIANSQFGSVSRVNELIQLNIDKYPNLSVNTPFLEQGWTFFLPPKDLPPTNGKLYKISGEITEENNRSWTIKGPGMAAGIYPDKNTKMLGKSAFTIGDCISVLEEGGTLKAFTVELQ